jgi:hypothetical protein
MNYFEFQIFLDRYFNEILSISLLFVLIYLFIYRKVIISIFDPFFFIVVASALSNAMILILYIYSDIRIEYLIQFFLTEVSFLIGFFIFKPIKLVKFHERLPFHDISIFNEKFIVSFFYVISISHIFLQFLSYYSFGIPLLADNRMTLYSGSGFGFIGRVLDLLTISGTVIGFYRFFFTKKYFFSKIYTFFYIFFLVLVQFLSGNKTNLLLLVYLVFLFQIYSIKIYGIKTHLINKTINKVQKYAVLVAIPFSFFVLSFQYINSGADRSNFNPVRMMTKRIFSFGDIYYMSLPNDNIKNMNSSKSSSFLHLIKSPLGMMRIYSWEELPIDLGLELNSAHVGNATTKGPNARYNYFAMLFYNNFAQMIYCFILGYIVSFIRNKLFLFLPRNIIFGVFYVYFSFNLLYLYQDQSYTISKYFDFFLFMPLFLLLSYVMSKKLFFKKIF